MRPVLRPVAVLMVGALLALSGCTGSEPGALRAGEVYDAVVRWFSAANDDDPEPLLIHVERWDDGALDLATQAEVVASAAEAATVRFIDSRDEALEWIDDVAQVRAEGVLIRLGPVPERGRQFDVLVDRWVNGDSFERLAVTVVQRATEWGVLGEPTSLGLIDIP
jgi:hypothetical protein